MLRKGLLMICAVAAISFTSCKEESAGDKVQQENIDAAASRDAAAQKFPVMTFEKTEHDFGTINDGDVVSTIFKFTNTGEAPLVIVSAKGSCGCTVPNDWPKEPIAPGATGQFTVKFDSKGKPNQQQKTVTVTANTEKGKELIKIKAFVNPAANAGAAPVLQ
ncbi:MAG: DUF1573 domain-containing protein [Flavobacteriaceae bacterium]|nr:DUF1573 domain-containing protein [Flavobacteriaceae bacterium]